MCGGLPWVCIITSTASALPDEFESVGYINILKGLWFPTALLWASRRTPASWCVNVGTWHAYARQCRQKALYYPSNCIRRSDVTFQSSPYLSWSTRSFCLIMLYYFLISFFFFLLIFLLFSWNTLFIDFGEIHVAMLRTACTSHDRWFYPYTKKINKWT